MEDDSPRCIDHFMIGDLRLWILGHGPGGVSLMLSTYLQFGKRGEEWRIHLDVFLHRLIREFRVLGQSLELEIL